MDNTLFNYHLQHLVKSGYIENINGKYSLTRDGNSITSNITNTGIIFPKFVCRFQLYVIDKENNRVLFQKWNRKPWKNNFTPISSKLLYGTNSNERASDRIKEKAGIEVEMKTIGVLRQFIANTKGEFLDENMYFIWVLLWRGCI
ncbi:MAG: hypothetical protein Q9M91_01940 [Candidatus Dojkabacteria bacterium]|nr:hypothetical protein [Candidatus Dojkabacteria bacterium]MDQ7020585.1 hypothetical protein [Candidatus Dojkabacteria bacterium]